MTSEVCGAGSTVFLDLDGTLTDPKPGITGCIQHALARLGRPVPEADALEWCIGPPLQESFARLVGVDDAARAVALYRERYGDVGLFENEVYQGVPEALGALRRGGAQLFVASSKPLVYVERILEHFGLAGFLEGAFGSELDGRRTDKRELLAHALEATGADAAASVMVGDRSHDGVGARHNGLAFVGVLYGYGSASELREAGAARLLGAPAELAEAARPG